LLRRRRRDSTCSRLNRNKISETKKKLFEEIKLHSNLMGVDGFIVKSIISLVGSVGIKFCNGGELKLSRGSVGLVGKGVIGQD